MGAPQPLACPFCNFEDIEVDVLLQHVNLLHPEDGEAPYLIKNGQEQLPQLQSMEGVSDWVECTCGEFCLLSEFEDHLDLHRSENTEIDDIFIPTEDVIASEAGRGKASASSIQPPVLTSLQATPYTTGPSSRTKSPPPQPAQYSSIHQSEGTSTTDQLTQLSRMASVKRATTIRKPLQPARLGVGDNIPLELAHANRMSQQAELGPYHDEAKMPDWLRDMLEKGGKVTVTNRISRDGRLSRIVSVANETQGIVPVLAQLCTQDNRISRAYLCHPDVTNVVKMPKEGGFCGYRNIQMMISCIQAAQLAGHEHFGRGIPSILRLQEMIEHAWDMGINPIGRAETGGIRGTRKYIGTPEADQSHVYDGLLEAVEEYFLQSSPDLSRKVCRTSLPPVYLQHRGHSLTIVGFERRKSGTCNLLVLDPMFKPSPGINRLLGSHFRCAQPEKLLNAYRRGGSYLKRYRSFEILKYMFSVMAQDVH
ncbi:MAG: hypothetical protein Q9163_001964 [Psora crenata]